MQLSSKAEFEAVPRSELYSFAVREFKLPAFQSPWHFHPECELTCIVQGSGARFVGDSIASFAPGDLVLLGSNLPHYWRSNTPARQRHEVAHSRVVQFREEFFGIELLGRPELHGVRRLLQQARRGLCFRGKTCEAVAVILAGMEQRSALGRLIDLLRILELLLAAKESEVIASPGFSPQLDALASARVNRTYEHVFAHFAEPLNHEAIARNAGMSLPAFCRYFKRITGRTLSDFINEVRVGNACKLLIETEQNISEIAFASGYENLSNFNRHFHELTGLSPREYRREHRPTKP